MKDNQLRYTFVVKVKDAAEFKKIAKKMVDHTKTEPGTLVYQWYCDDDATHCTVYERYKDSDAWIKHVTSNKIQKLLPQLLNHSEMQRFDIYGNVSKEARKMMDNFGATYLDRKMGFER